MNNFNFNFNFSPFNNQIQLQTSSWNNNNSNRSILQDPYNSRTLQFTLPGPTSLLAGAPPTIFNTLNHSISLIHQNHLNQDQPNFINPSNQSHIISNSSNHSQNNHLNYQSQSILNSSTVQTLQTFREQMDRVYNQANSVSFDIVAQSQPVDHSSDTSNQNWGNNIIQDPSRLPYGSIEHNIRSHLPNSDWSLPLTDQPSSTPFPINESSSNEHTFNVQNSNHEFVDHSTRLRLNRRPRLSPVPSSSSDHDISESLESFRRCGERLRRGLPGTLLHSNNSTFNRKTDTEPREPTTAELAEAAARASNEHHALPAFYSPDHSLKVIKVVIPIDTNPMERRKIIFEASKDGSIRWKDADQKAVYERSKDGLVGEEIGEIEFDYINFPKRKKRSSNSLSSLGTGSQRSNQSSTFPLQRPANQSNTHRATGETIERINQARTQETRSIRDHHYTYYPNRYQLYQHPRYRLVGASRRHVPLNRDISFDLPNPHRHSSTTNRELHLSSSRPTSSEIFSSSNHNNNNTHRNSSSRLTRRPISWSERFYLAPSDHHRSLYSSIVHRDQERDQHDNSHVEPSEQEDNSIHDDFDWDHPTPPFVQSPPFYESDPSHPLVHFQ